MFATLKLIYGLIALLLFWCLLSSEVNADIPSKPMTEACLGCLCEAMSGCNATAICVNGACGIFRITWSYWVEAGQLALETDTAVSMEAFNNCVNDPLCAADTVQHYMYKHGQDCNNDGLINCLDYGAIHKLGNLKCASSLPYDFGKTFNTCLEVWQKLS